MARIRSVKPELRTSALVASWPFEMRYFWVLLWGYLDDKGRGLDSPKAIAGDCFPHDEQVSAGKVDRWLNRMLIGLEGEPGPICRYELAGRRYLHAVNWGEHQRPNRPTASRLPPCPLHAPLTEPLPEPLPEPDDEPLPEPLHGNSMPGEGEQGSRGAGEQGTSLRSVARKRASERATRIPEPFKVTPDMVTWVRERFPAVNGQVETEKFINYWRGKAGKDAKKVDWVATWRNWMINAAQRAPTLANGMHPTDANIAKLLGQTQLRALPGGES